MGPVAFKIKKQKPSKKSWDIFRTYVTKIFQDQSLSFCVVELAGTTPASIRLHVRRLQA
jgi:hypothetical protein